jgi:hypothetical protein
VSCPDLSQSVCLRRQDHSQRQAAGGNQASLDLGDSMDSVQWQRSRLALMTFLLSAGSYWLMDGGTS